MKAPKCRLCGAHHGLAEAHQWAEPEIDQPEPAVPWSKPARMANRTLLVANVVDSMVNTNDVVANTAGGGANSHGSYKYRDPDKRRAYMRDYMKARRAKQRVAG